MEGGIQGIISFGHARRIVCELERGCGCTRLLVVPWADCLLLGGRSLLIRSVCNVREGFNPLTEFISRRYDMNWQEFTCPNLDSIPEEELRTWMRVFSDLQEYCRRSLLAREARLDGNIQQANRDEGRAEQHYLSLPKEVRW